MSRVSLHWLSSCLELRVRRGVMVAGSIDESIIIIITESTDRFESTAESTSSMTESMTERIAMSAERRNRVWHVCDGW
jgi:hypothetical protein